MYITHSQNPEWAFRIGPNRRLAARHLGGARSVPSFHLHSQSRKNQAHSSRGERVGLIFVCGASGQERLPKMLPSEPVPVSGSASFLAKLVVHPLSVTASTKTLEAAEPVPTLTP